MYANTWLWPLATILSSGAMAFTGFLTAVSGMRGTRQQAQMAQRAADRQHEMSLLQAQRLELDRQRADIAELNSKYERMRRAMLKMFRLLDDVSGPEWAELKTELYANLFDGMEAQ